MPFIQLILYYCKWFARFESKNKLSGGLLTAVDVGHMANLIKINPSP